MGKVEKTNVMRLLDQKKIPYDMFTYEPDSTLTGVDVARLVGIDENMVFKTLVTRGHSKKNYVFVIPVGKELDLKKAAKASSEKSIEMVKSKELLDLTGYIHGGCSPIGMKKQFETYIDESAMNFKEIVFSAGKIGFQVKVDVTDLKKMVPFEFNDLCE